MSEQTVDETNVDTPEPSLEDFEKDFYPHLKEEAAPAAETEEEEVEATEQEEIEEEDSTEEVDDLATEEEEEDPQPKGKKGKNSAQERINELTAKLRQSERDAQAKLDALMREVETLKAGREKEEAKPLREALPDGAPDPDAKDEEGNPVYELGEFDPKYIRDLTKFTIAEETKAAKEAKERADYEEGVKAAQAELVDHWATKVAEVEESIPTIRDDITHLTETFEQVDPAYGEYLAMTIMQCENGPEIMHYFSNNIGEAQKIVAAGPAAATLAIGRLEAMLNKSSTDKGEQTRNRVSNAPTPPPKGARGVNGRQTVRPDTNNLDAFEEIFFPKKK